MESAVPMQIGVLWHCTTNRASVRRTVAILGTPDGERLASPALESGDGLCRRPDPRRGHQLRLPCHSTGSCPAGSASMACRSVWPKGPSSTTTTSSKYRELGDIDRGRGLIHGRQRSCSRRPLRRRRPSRGAWCAPGCPGRTACSGDARQPPPTVGRGAVRSRQCTK
jgi:hypothetical protein